MKCSSCGADVPEGAVFCPNCGARLEEQKEQGESMEDVLAKTVTIDAGIVDYTYQKGCSQAGFMPEEVVTVEDLLYGTILPSGGDAAMTLAAYVSGDEEAFAEKMNDKIAELGLSRTAHFTNSVGLYDENHHHRPRVRGARTQLPFCHACRL